MARVRGYKMGTKSGIGRGHNRKMKTVWVINTRSSYLKSYKISLVVCALLAIGHADQSEEAQFGSTDRVRQVREGVSNLTAHHRHTIYKHCFNFYKQEGTGSLYTVIVWITVGDLSNLCCNTRIYRPIVKDPYYQYCYSIWLSFIILEVFSHYIAMLCFETFIAQISVMTMVQSPVFFQFKTNDTMSSLDKGECYLIVEFHFYYNIKETNECWIFFRFTKQWISEQNNMIACTSNFGTRCWNLLRTISVQQKSYKSWWSL